VCGPITHSGVLEFFVARFRAVCWLNPARVPGKREKPSREKCQMMKLYNFHGSSTSYRARIVLNLKGLQYEYIPIRLDKGEHLSDSYGKINPMRGVPTLELENGARLYQSSVIIEYLEENYPAPSLLPKEPIARARVRALAAIVGSDMHPVNNLRIRKFIGDVY
jgi:maleylacetoacetate isomerase